MNKRNKQRKMYEILRARIKMENKVTNNITISTKLKKEEDISYHNLEDRL